MNRRGFFMTTLLAGFVTAVFAAPAAKPVALAGASYGHYEVESLIRNVLSTSRESQVVYEEWGGTIQTQALDRFSLVIIANGLGQPLTPDESRALADYVRGGGHVLLIGQAPRFLAETIGFTNLAWVGLSRIQPGQATSPCAVAQPDSPWLKGVLEGQPDPAWLKGGAVATPAADGMKVVIGTPGGAALVGMRELGKGWVAFLGQELFRMRGAKSPLRPDSLSWIRLAGNIVDSAGPLRESDVREAGFRAAAGKDLLVWSREWQKGEPYGPRFDPPLPAESEATTRLAAEMAVDEYELLQLNLTPLVDLGLAQGRFESATFPTNHARLFVQDCPDPIPWPKDPSLAREFPYWLMPPESVAPKARPEFALPVRETRILWIKLDTFGVAPGRYALTFKLDFAGGKRVAIPVEVVVHPVRLPRHRLITLMPGGAGYGDVREAGPAVRFMDNLESNGFEWSILNIVRAEDCRIRGETNGLTVAVLRAHRDRLLAGDFPALDFRALDGWVESSIARNQTQFRAGDIAVTLRPALKQAGIRADAQPPIEQWFCREFSRYLREKGSRIMIASIGDEMSERELTERFLPWARSMTDAGWGCASTFTGGAHATPALNGKLYPFVGLWTLNRGLALPFTEGLRSGQLKVRPGAIIGTYGAGEGRGTEVRKTPARSRFLGWESWMLGIQNCMPNPYFKGWLYYADYNTKDLGLAGERFVSYLEKDDLSAPLANSPFMEGIREGMEEGNLAAILSWYLNRLPASPATSAVRARVQKILGPEPDALLRWRSVDTGRGLCFRQIDAGSAAYRAAKGEVLACLDALRAEALESVKPSLFWNNVPLLKAGEAVAAIYAPEDAPVDELTASIRSLCGRELPVVRNADALAPRYPVAIVVGNGSRNPLAKTTLAGAGEADATAAYPGAGGYLVKELKRPGVTDGTILVVTGPDAAGLSKGIRMFSRFLRAEGAWLLPEPVTP